MDDTIFDSLLDEQLCFRLYRASSGIGKLYSQTLIPVELTFSQYLVLLALWDGVAISYIAARTGMGIGTLNPILKRMTENGWIKRQTPETDKRMRLIFLTEKAYGHKATINRSILTHLAACDFAGLNLLELMKQLDLLQKQLDAINHKF